MSPARHASDEQMDAATWCRHLIPDRSVYAFLADHRHQLFPPEAFADLTRQGPGHPSVPAELVASVMVLQALEGLSDREAVSALRRDIAWKVACGLRLDDEGFHPTVLVHWRNRIRRSQRPKRIVDAVREVVEATGVLGGRRRRVLDSTLLEDAVATQDTITQLTTAIRRVRQLIPPTRQVKSDAHDYDRAGKPDCDWEAPAARQALVSGLVTDALAVLGVVADAELSVEQAQAVALLALVAGQDVEAGERPGTWRIARRVARDRVLSTVDPEARHAHKTSAHKHDGYKAHLEAEPETGLVTACALTAASAADGPTGVGLLDGEEAGLEVLGDSAYGAGETRAALTTAGHQQTIKPAPLAAAVPGGFTKHDFTIDDQAGTVTCPAGYQASDRGFFAPTATTSAPRPRTVGCAHPQPQRRLPGRSATLPRVRAGAVPAGPRRCAAVQLLAPARGPRRDRRATLRLVVVPVRRRGTPPGVRRRVPRRRHPTCHAAAAWMAAPYEPTWIGVAIATSSSTQAPAPG